MYKPSFSREQFELLEDDVLYDGKFKIRQYTYRCPLYQGGHSPVIKRECFDRGDSVAVLGFDPKRDEVLLIEQIRVGAFPALDQSPWLLEIVAGSMDGENESPEDVARREMVEESGCAAKSLERICDYWPSPGGTSERVYVFLAEVDTSAAGGVHGLVDENENIKVCVMPRQQAFDLVKAGQIRSGVSLIALQWLEINYHNRFAINQDEKK